ncbi:aminopeptidase N [uncultured Jatrophihabitans sp.]|uniref:aminopeptidase N n=1 Tax=uncultured Jatrophihabitans sp. TaxID=1610747 RepID=UPI0035C9AA94
MTGLTRTTAQARAAQLRVSGYAVALDLREGGDYFTSVTNIRFVAHPGDRGAGPVDTFADVRPSSLRAVRLNGRDLDTDACFDGATGRVTFVPDAGENELVVDAVMAYSGDGEGLHRHVDPADGRTYLYAMSFLDAAPRWFACFDQPDLKAPVELDVRCPDEWRVAGNGPATELEPGRWQVAATGPLATYFTTLVAGPYHEVRDGHDGTVLVLHVRQSLAEHLDRQAERLFAHTKHCLDELNGLFGVRYPWGEYHQAFVPDFNAGAMENPGCVTLRDQMIFRSRATDAELADRDVTIAHEMAHMWFGDLVTMRWWDDLWLNESFAEYLGHRVCGEQTWPAFGIERKSWGYAADRRPSTHPVAGNAAADTEEALGAFDGISYAKGASVLRQLATRLGDDLFLTGLRGYVAAHANGNAEFADLIAAWNAAGAQDLDAWARDWLRTSGLDTLAVEGDTVVRTSVDGARRPHAVAVARFDGRGAEAERHDVVVDADRVPLAGPKPLDEGGPGLTLLDPGDRTWAKITVADWPTVRDVLPVLADPSARVVLWNALQLAVADADVDPRAALDLVAGAVAPDTDAVLARVGRWAARTASTYVTPADRDASVDPVRRAFGEIVASADPGSARQLAAFRLAAAAEPSPDALQGWLAGAVADGIEVDHELRWLLLGRLAQLGELSASQLADEQAADPTSTGALRAAYCRAATPTPQAKAEAWERLVADGQASNYELYALAEGFWVPSQHELTAPYVERYFDDVVTAAGLRSGFVVERLTALLYPWTAVEDDTWAATQRLLARDDLHAGLRRSVVDAGDDLRRALESRRRFAR